MLNFKATTKVKNLQNHVRGVRNHTLRVCDIQREQTLFKHGLKVKNWPRNGPKIDQKFTKVEQHSHRQTRHAGDGHDEIAKTKCVPKTTRPTHPYPSSVGPWGGIKGGEIPSLGR